MEIEIRRTGIEGLVKHVPVEVVGSLDHKDVDYNGMLDRYQEYLDGPHGSSYFVHGIVDLDVLTPEEIDSFSKLTVLFSEHARYGKTGYFISKLIYDSHNSGHSEFTIHPPGEIDLLCSYLSGEDRSLTITVIGNAGDHFGTACKGVGLTITGNTGNACGYASIDSEYRLNGDVGNAAGMSSERSRFTITGDTEYYLGSDSKGAVFHVDGKMEKCCGKGAVRSTFRTTDKETLKKMRLDVDGFNRVSFIKGEKEKKLRRPLRYIGAHIAKFINERKPVQDD